MAITRRITKKACAKRVSGPKFTTEELQRIQRAMRRSNYRSIAAFIADATLSHCRQVLRKAAPVQTPAA